MAEVHGKNMLHRINSVSAESYTKQVTVNVDNDIVDSTTAGDTSKASLEGIYSWNMDGDYVWNGGSGQIDYTIFRTLGSGALTNQVVPGGGTVSNDNPIYRGSAILKSYSITVPHDGVIAAKASWQGNGALNRYTSGNYTT